MSTQTTSKCQITAAHGPYNPIEITSAVLASRALNFKVVSQLDFDLAASSDFRSLTAIVCDTRGRFRTSIAIILMGGVAHGTIARQNYGRRVTAAPPGGLLSSGRRRRYLESRALRRYHTNDSESDRRSRSTSSIRCRDVAEYNLPPSSTIVFLGDAASSDKNATISGTHAHVRTSCGIF
ncbi:hypothetical protein EVAR_66762_1 [Eumeta japonica]|uniref:Uncharacterized protein n=1 Tax=Eumeta variegata TaxID=151549 RepID=A0A4C1Z377_EUMVA|nr:hypothetical protein EVAR_66762_1 [Eumeta japonica]